MQERYVSYCFVLIFLIALSFVPTLFLNYIGEEAVYTVSSYEMHAQHEYLVPLYYGDQYWRPPLFNWLIIPLAQIVSWKHVLIAARLVTAVATLGTAWVCFRFTKMLFRNETLALWSCLIYLTSDASFYHGWIAYADPLYSFFCFAAVATLWASVLNRNTLFLVLSLILLSAGYLTKAITGYFFYFTTFLGLFYFYKESRHFLIQRSPLLFLGFIVPGLWGWITHLGTHSSQGMGMIEDIASKWSTKGQGFSGLTHYLISVIHLPIEWILTLFPLSLLFLYGLIRKDYKGWKSFVGAKEIPLIFSLFIVNLLPYWLSPQGYEARYLMMLYPLFAVLLGVFFYGAQKARAFFYSVGGLVILKWIGVCLVLPLYLHFYRGDYANTATMILKDVGNQPLYIQDVTAVGESIAVNIDLQRAPLPPLSQFLPLSGHYFVLRDPDSSPPLNEHFVRIYPSSTSHSRIALYEVQS